VKSLVNCGTIAYIQVLRTCFSTIKLYKNMGFFKKITKPFEKAAEVVTKPFAKISDKFIPNELRFLAMPYAAGIGSLMLPPTMSPWLRALASGGMNVAGQIASDESSTGDLSDINLLSTALATGYGGMGSNKFSKNGMRLVL
jgi:hypothetical protein